MRLATNIFAGFEVAYHRELATLVPTNPGLITGSPSNLWLVPTASPPPAPEPSAGQSPQVNGTRLRSSTLEDHRPARQDKKRRSLAFFKGPSASESPSKAEKLEPDEEPLELVSTTTTSLRRASKDNSKPRNHSSMGFFDPASPPLEALPQFSSQTSSRHSLSQDRSRSHSTERRSETSRSGRSSSDQQRKGNVRKRLSILNIGKKSSKNSVMSRFDDSLVEE
jgi:dedicator of cytokinesis protein 3